MNTFEDFIYPVVDEMADTLKNGNLLKKSPDTALFGADSVIDSLGLVNFIVAVEGRIEEQLNRSVTLANEQAMSRQKSPFRTMKTLAEYIDELLKDKSNG